MEGTISTPADPSVPVEGPIPNTSDTRRAGPEEGIALCLSGGGYRAMLFHVGALWRLNELGFLPRLARVSSVSGGSITAGVLGMNFERLDFDSSGVAREFESHLVAPVRSMADRTIDWPSVVVGMLTPASIGGRAHDAYDRHLFKGATLQDLPDEPRFVINASNAQSGALWRFMKPYMRDYKVGEVRDPATSLATAVAASAAFPPFLAPIRLKLDPGRYRPPDGETLHRPPFTTNVFLMDGGVYDNLGLETAWKRYDTILVSDAGGKMAPMPDVKADWLRQTRRVLDLIDNQVRSLRKRQLIDSYESGARKGAYWGIRTEIANYGLPDALEAPPEATSKLAEVSTRLARVDATTQERLINWGYIVCDAAMRKHMDPGARAPAAVPYPAAGIG